MRDLPVRPVRIAGRIRCPDPILNARGERLVARHRDVQVQPAGRGWRSIERIRESRGFELWDHGGSLPVDPSHAAEPLVVIPHVWRGSTTDLEDPSHLAAVERAGWRADAGTLGHPHGERRRAVAAAGQRGAGRGRRAMAAASTGRLRDLRAGAGRRHAPARRAASAGAARGLRSARGSAWWRRSRRASCTSSPASEDHGTGSHRDQRGIRRAALPLLPSVHRFLTEPPFVELGAKQPGAQAIARPGE